MEETKSWKCGLRKIRQGEETYWFKQSAQPDREGICGHKLSAQASNTKPEVPRERLARKVQAIQKDLIALTEELDTYGIGKRNVNSAIAYLEHAYEHLSE